MVCGREQISIENGSFIKLFCLLSRKFTIPTPSATHFFLKALPVAKEPSVATPRPLNISLISDISLLTLSYSIKYIYVGLKTGDTSRAATCNQNNSFFLTLNMQT